MDALEESKWYSVEEKFDFNMKRQQGSSVKIYTDLLFDKSLSVRARLFQGLLQLTPDFKEDDRQCSYLSLSKELNMGLKSVRNAVEKLVESGWLAIKQKNRLAPLFLTMRHPIREASEKLATRIQKNLNYAMHKGEGLMKAILTLTVASDKYTDNGKLGILINDETDSPMEFDRYYPDFAIAFEFNGTQHYRPTDLYNEETVRKQQARDRLKEMLSAKNGIKLITIQPQDLTVNSILQKIGDSLPLQDLRYSKETIKYLERLCAGYRKNTPAFVD
jgi:hypothetical protein